MVMYRSAFGHSERLPVICAKRAARYPGMPIVNTGRGWMGSVVPVVRVVSIYIVVAVYVLELVMMVTFTLLPVPVAVRGKMTMVMVVVVWAMVVMVWAVVVVVWVMVMVVVWAMVMVSVVHGMRIDRVVAVGVAVTVSNALPYHMNRVDRFRFFTHFRRRVVTDGHDRHHSGKGNEGTEENRGLASMHHCEMSLV